MSTPLYLSRARLRAERGEALSAIAPILLPDDEGRRAGRAHRLIWLLFQDQPDAARDFLWRQETDGRFMILSSRPPQAPPGLFDLETKSFEPDLDVGTELRFMLHANPTVARKSAAAPGRDGARTRGKRVDVVMDALAKVPPSERAKKRDQCIADTSRKWLDDQGGRAGFTVRELDVTGYSQEDVSDQERRGRRPRATISTADFAGVLALTDPPAFLAKLAKGFGSAKAFGCGLMLIRRA